MFVQHTAPTVFTHKHNHLTAFCSGLPGWAGTRRNVHSLTPMIKKKKDSHRQQVPLHGSASLYGTLSLRGLLNPIKPAYNQKSARWLAQINSQCLWLWISMPAVLVTVPTVMQNLLSSGFYGAGKITEADALTIHLDATPSGLLVPPPLSSPHFYAECPFCHNPHDLSWLGKGTA